MGLQARRGGPATATLHLTTHHQQHFIHSNTSPIIRRLAAITKLDKRRRRQRRSSTGCSSGLLVASCRSPLLDRHTPRPTAAPACSRGGRSAAAAPQQCSSTAGDALPPSPPSAAAAAERQVVECCHVDCPRCTCAQLSGASVTSLPGTISSFAGRDTAGWCRRGSRQWSREQSEQRGRCSRPFRCVRGPGRTEPASTDGRELEPRGPADRGRGWQPDAICSCPGPPRGRRGRRPPPRGPGRPAPQSPSHVAFAWRLAAFYAAASRSISAVVSRWSRRTCARAVASTLRLHA